MHDEDPEIDRLRAQAADPATTPERQFELSTQHPDLLPVLATNPALYADLRAWLASLGDPAIDEGLELAAARAAASAEAASDGARRRTGGGADTATRRSTGTAPEGIPLDETATLPRVSARRPGEPPVRTSLGVRRGTGRGGPRAAHPGTAPTTSEAAAPRGQGPPAGAPQPTTVLPAVHEDAGPAGTAQDEAARRRRAGCGLALLALTLAVVGLLWTTGTVSLASPARPIPASFPPDPSTPTPLAEEVTWPLTEPPG